MMTQRGDAISYSAAHERVKTLRGPARTHLCVSCGGPAIDWAYRNSSPKERVQLTGYANNQRYSPDPEDYDPMCKKCHYKRDFEHNSLEPAFVNCTHSRKPPNINTQGKCVTCRNSKRRAKDKENRERAQ